MKRSILAERSDNIFGQRGRYKKLGQLLARLQRRKGELLKVLERSENSLYTSASEDELRACVISAKSQAAPGASVGARHVMSCWADEDLRARLASPSSLIWVTDSCSIRQPSASRSSQAWWLGRAPEASCLRVCSPCHTSR